MHTQALSGGEKQRVALAKALTKLPEVLLLDEPFSNLDFIHKQIIKEVLENVSKQWETTIIMVSHEPRDVLPWADTIMVMKAGIIVQTASPQEIYNRPKNEYVAGLFGKFNMMNVVDWHIENKDQFTQIKQKAIVRPEQLTITKEKGQGVKGEVLKVKYHGSFYEITVKVANQQLLIETDSSEYREEDQVFVGVAIN